MRRLTFQPVGRQAALLACILFTTCISQAQEKYHAKDNMQLSISGTSSMHDWTMTATKGEGTASFAINPSGHLTGLTFLNFTMPVSALKSEHSSMDKNAYKALKSAEFSSITYNLTSATVLPDGTIKCQGQLTIAGTTMDAELLATAKVNADKTIVVKGSKKISMKDFKITPPSFMLGAVKTGNDILLQFDLQLVKI